MRFNRYYFLIIVFVIIFFYPVFQGKIPFPGDLLVNENPYQTESFLGYAPSGMPNKAQGTDVIKEIYPWKYFAISQIKKGVLPFWNPYNFSGNPQLANFQTAVFYPFNLLYLILPFNIAWTFFIMLQPILAGVFMYLFLRKGIGLKDFPSTVGALSFGFSSYMAVWMEYGNIGSTILWLPLVLLFTKYFFRKANSLSFLGITISLTFAILAGYIQGVFYIYLLSFLYYNYLTFTTKGNFQKHKKNFLFLVSLFLPLILTSFQILPTLALFSESTRGAYTLAQIERNLSPIINLITVIIPDFFGNPATRNYWIDGTYIERVMYPGTVILFFSLYAFFNKINFLEKKFFAIVAIVSLIIATNFPLVKFFYLIPIPVISTTVATRELNVFIFSMIVLGSMGIEYFLTEKQFKKNFAYFYLGVFVLIWILIFTISKIMPNISQNLKISERNLIIPSVLALLMIGAVLLKKINKWLALSLILILVLFDLFYFFNKITPFSSSQLTYPKTPVGDFIKKDGGIDRFWGYGSAYIPSNFQTVDKVFSPEGNDPLHVENYGKLLTASGDGNLPKILPRPDANVFPGYGTDDLKTNFYRKRALDLLGVKYILNKNENLGEISIADEQTFPKNEYNLVWQKSPWQVYENKNALPRFFMANKYLVIKDKDLVLKTIYSKGLDLRNFILLEEKPSISIDESLLGTSTLLSYAPNNVSFKTQSLGNNILFLSDNYYSDWEVFVDGKREKILVADYTFRGVAVPKGEHKVDFIYNPKSFNLGLKLSFFGLILLAVILFVIKHEKKN